MKVFSSMAAAVSSGEMAGAHLCLGNFDGVHLGHRALIDACGPASKSAALTFSPHPGKVLQPELAPRLICTLPRRLELLGQAATHWVVVQPFDLAYARTSAPDFEASLFSGLKVQRVVVGYDFTYGTKRTGTVATLETACKKAGAELVVVPPVTVDGVVVSSSKIREYVLEGRVTAAQKLLGRYFDLDGTVVRGQGRGRTIGFPTANIETTNELKPAPGVYVVRVVLSDDGTQYAGAANIGVKPTFDGKEATLEVHLLDFEGDLYGKPLRVQFIERLRAEQRFESVAALKEQIGRDVVLARTILDRA